ncbi:penicillin-binding protein activator LpoB [Agarilytica rhodophyticola]|uniref:penicillin-binding protein activator LpoB n=1 Tax=Agarilytica rhodophyticola TaxID=1737490 RepID=UPI00157149B6|nr:penicillin-binding protein activator LpoB [Agarilytica rhodophyticola]
MRLVYKLSIFTIFSAALLAGCSSTPTVQRIDVEEVRDLSGSWNDTDSRLVSKEMVDDMLSRPWVEQHISRHGNIPAVIVGTVRNLSHEHISVKTFINDIEREITNSGEVTFVANSQERSQIRDERADQDLNASERTRNAMGQELGADYMMIGSINTIVDAAAKQQVVYYQTDLKLVSMADNRTVWIGQKKIKKLVQKRKVRY